MIEKNEHRVLGIIYDYCQFESNTFYWESMKIMFYVPTKLNKKRFQIHTKICIIILLYEISADPTK